MRNDKFGEDYFERGIETGVSLYQNYRWMPELTISMAMVMIDLLGIKRGESVLDMGCAKGYLVKAMRLLGREAWGMDVSKYAIANTDEKVKQYCFLLQDPLLDFLPVTFDFCIAKDVFEHLTEDELRETLLRIKAKKLFVVVPLGDDGGYRAVANDLDITHVICESEQWWSKVFMENGWEEEVFTFQVEGIKDGYYKKYPSGHGFFTLKRKTK